MKFLWIMVALGWLPTFTEFSWAAVILNDLDPTTGLYSINDVHDVPDSGRIPDSIDDPGFGSDVTYIFDPLIFGSSAPVDTVFTIRQSSGTSEYLIDQFFSFSPIGPLWSGFRFELGTGTGGSFSVEASGPDKPQFVLPNPFDPLNPANSADFGDQWSVSVSNSSPTLLVWSGDTFLTDGSLEMAFLIDIPDYSGNSDTTTFTLRQLPVLLPEPTSGLGLLLGLGVTMRRRRKRRALHLFSSQSNWLRVGNPA